ncbi:hypothetical protein [Bradyrhizobium sp. WU425]|uniref:hypothetical protein n=1 Tax=Bradyrhizobium sp. WU425 TaxID=187029 RepID=UPI001E3E05F3|nr:hypothetical protein [Bradyrhizobium canariense]UFW71388.1 hypothetical protein BcanWU425_32890 [Bradyrhizobium canariense]
MCHLNERNVIPPLNTDAAALAHAELMQTANAAGAISGIRMARRRSPEITPRRTWDAASIVCFFELKARDQQFR